MTTDTLHAHDRLIGVDAKPVRALVELLAVFAR